ncbi:MAG: hypothetical protein N3G20_10100, partial [Verrucomicrobiae bacterium]|nr:hypothetical protein [Verrucomicrobiae bacterium]
PGYEMRDGLMPFGVVDGVRLTNSAPNPILVRQVIENGGVLFYAHPEEPRDWDLQGLTGMEIYNLHADFKDERRGFLGLLPDILLNFDQYPHLVYRMIFDKPIDNLAKWDQLNRTRHVTGVGGNDCHQNTGYRVICTATNSIRCENAIGKTLWECTLNPVSRFIASIVLGPLEAGRSLFEIQLDPYDLMSMHVTTHVFARSLTEHDILESLKTGRAFVGFDLLADSTGFLWYATNRTTLVLPGESMPFSDEVFLCAVAPCRCRLTILRNGHPVQQTEGTSLRCRPAEPGVYRAEAELKIRGKWTPWVYTNPIWLVVDKTAVPGVVPDRASGQH